MIDCLKYFLNTFTWRLELPTEINYINIFEDETNDADTWKGKN